MRFYFKNLRLFILQKHKRKYLQIKYVVFNSKDFIFWCGSKIQSAEKISKGSLKFLL